MTIKQYALDLTFLTWFCAQVTASAFIVRVASPTGANRAQLRIPNRSSTSATAGRIFFLLIHLITVVIHVKTYRENTRKTIDTAKPLT